MQNVFYHPIIVDALRGAEKKFHITTSDNQNQYVAEVLQVEAIKSLQADILLKVDKNIINLYGHVNAKVELKSVISLENFDKIYNFDFEMVFDKSLNYQKQRELENEGFDAPDLIVGGTIDLANIIIEQLALNIEDYPRKEGEEFKL